jgi:hypothetical protein
MLEKLPGSRMSDGTQVFHDLTFGHPDPGIRKRDFPVVLIDLDFDFQGKISIGDRFIFNLLVANFFQGIRGVGNQFPHKNLPVGIQGVNHNIQHLPNFRLELMTSGWLRLTRDIHITFLQYFLYRYYKIP